MEPFYFGNKLKLFGIYHAPLKESKEIGVVICNPIGQEFIRSYRCLHKLSMQLSSSGFHVLRFDYFGTGDSLGTRLDGNIDEWIENITDAINELKASIGITKICLIGLRLGASLSLMASQRGVKVDSTILWNPILRGTSYLDEIVSNNEKYFQGSFAQNTYKMDGCKEILGFPYTDNLISQLEQIELLNDPNYDINKIVYIENVKSPNGPMFLDNLSKKKDQITYKYIEDHIFWLMTNNKTSKGIVPINTLNSISKIMEDLNS